MKKEMQLELSKNTDILDLENNFIYISRKIHGIINYLFQFSH